MGDTCIIVGATLIVGGSHHHAMFIASRRVYLYIALTCHCAESHPLGRGACLWSGPAYKEDPATYIRMSLAMYYVMTREASCVILGVVSSERNNALARKVCAYFYCVRVCTL